MIARRRTEAMLAEYEPLVRHEVDRLHLYGGRDAFEDLLQVGRIELFRAHRQYDPNHMEHASFRTFAKRWVRGKLLNYVDRKLFFGQNTRERRLLVRLESDLTDGERRQMELQGAVEPGYNKVETADLIRHLLRQCHSSQRPLASQVCADASDEAIAETCGGPVNSSSSRRAHIRKTLRRVYSSFQEA